MNASPPMPVIFGSVTFSIAAMAMAASTALPPRFRTSRPTCEASGWLVATMALLARTTDRPAGRPENHRSGGVVGAPVAWAEASKGPEGTEPVIADAQADISRNSRRLKLLMGTIILTR